MEKPSSLYCLSEFSFLAQSLLMMDSYSPSTSYKPGDRPFSWLLSSSWVWDALGLTCSDSVQRGPAGVPVALLTGQALAEAGGESVLTPFTHCTGVGWRWRLVGAVGRKPARWVAQAAKSQHFDSIWLDLAALAQSFWLTSTLLMLSNYSDYLLCITLMLWNEGPKASASYGLHMQLLG